MVYFSVHKSAETMKQCAVDLFFCDNFTRELEGEQISPEIYSTEFVYWLATRRLIA